MATRHIDSIYYPNQMTGLHQLNVYYREIKSQIRSQQSLPETNTNCVGDSDRLIVIYDLTQSPSLTLKNK